MNPNTLLPSLRKAIPTILAFQLFLGGQARLLSLLTPRLHAKAMRKAVGTRDAFYPLIPIRDVTRHTNFIGGLMCVAGGLVAWGRTRGTLGVGATIGLTGMGVYSQRRMGVSYWLPVVNMGLAVVMWWLERRSR